MSDSLPEKSIPAVGSEWVRRYRGALVQLRVTGYIETSTGLWLQVENVGNVAPQNKHSSVAAAFLIDKYAPADSIHDLS